MPFSDKDFIVHDADARLETTLALLKGSTSKQQQVSTTLAKNIHFLMDGINEWQ
jgi:hypothetical protein